MRLKTINTALFTMLVSLAFLQKTKAQAPALGFVQQDNIKVSGIFTDAQIFALPANQKSTTKTYYDGMGRTVQVVGVAASPLQNDLIQPVVYDSFGRQAKSYLPYAGQSTDASGSYRANAIAEQASFYANGLSDKVADDNTPYSQRSYEYSPLQRLVSEVRAGDAFAGHNKSFNYRSNNTTADGNIIIWNPDGTNAGYYPLSTLTVSEGKDEDQTKAASFADEAGHTVLKRQYGATADTYFDTYYIYNEAGMVSYVIPPKAIAIMIGNNNYSLTQTGVDKLIFKYLYDERGRLIQKTTPSSGMVSMVYDPLGRLVLLQDANMALQYKWHYIKYDAKNHPISQGLYIDPNSYTTVADMQAAVNASTIYNTYRFEIRSTNAGTGNYSNNTFPNSNITPYSYNYYDNYDINMDGTDDYQYRDQSAWLPSQNSQTQGPTKGMLTMVKKATIGSGLTSGTWIIKCMFYDDRGRVIQTRSNNQTTSSLSDDNTIVLDFIGTPNKLKITKVVNGNSTTVVSAMSYDHMQRIKTIDQSYNGATAIRIAAYDYNEIGQLVTKNLHSTNNGSTFLQSIDYRYNINGQLLSINNSKLSTDWGSGSGYTNSDSNDLFGMQFLYEQTDSNLGNTPYYGGKVSAVKWMSKDANGTASYERSYTYTYDALNRYTASTYAERTPTGTGAFNNNVNGFDEHGITYDVNGNILTLKRNTSIHGTNGNTEVDNLTYTYDANNPNRLSSVSDGSGSSYTSFGFKNITGSTTGTYNYDVNGNMTADPYKGITLTYNDINRTQQINITSTGQYLNYTYDAGGTLLRKQAYYGGTTHTTDYIDGFVYQDNTISYFAMPEGRVYNSSSGLKPEYIIKDNQGNARMSFEDNGSGTAVVKQENSYYGFGMPLANSPVPTPSLPNKNLYNGGSELQNDLGGLPDLQQTFYRNYDAALGRFVGVDPEAESSESMSAYQYGNDNPILFNDPMGNNAIDAIVGKILEKSNGLGGTWNSETGDISVFSSVEDELSAGAAYFDTYALWGKGTNAKDYQDLINRYNDNIGEEGHYVYDTQQRRYASVMTYFSGLPSGLNGISGVGSLIKLDNSPDHKIERRIDKAGVLDASVNLLSGGIEIAGTDENPIVGIDGVFRVAFNTIRLGGYLSYNKEFGDAMPSNIGAMVGKWMDGNDFYKVGNGQKWGGFINDYSLFIYTLGNGSQLETIFDPEAEASTLQKLSAGYSITANYYMFWGDLK